MLYFHSCYTAYVMFPYMFQSMNINQNQYQYRGQAEVIRDTSYTYD